MNIITQFMQWVRGYSVPARNDPELTFSNPGPLVRALMCPLHEICTDCSDKVHCKSCGERCTGLN